MIDIERGSILNFAYSIKYKSLKQAMPIAFQLCKGRAGGDNLLTPLW